MSCNRILILHHSGPVSKPMKFQINRFNSKDVIVIQNFSVLQICQLSIRDQVRSGMRVYAGGARRRDDHATVLLRPPSGHRPGRRQARHARIHQIGLHYLTRPRDGTNSDYFPVNTGVRQGCVLAPTLFNLHGPCTGKDVEEVGLQSVVRNCPDH